MRTAINLTGQTFGFLVVVSQAKSTTNKGAEWECRCVCGATKIVLAYRLKDGTTKSCGCMMRQLVSESRSTHGKTNTPEFWIWTGIKTRCYNQNEKGYKYYGGKGITVCQRWLDSFDNFLADMGTRPTSKHSIERLNSDGNYEPSNCKWATRIEQNNNTSRNRPLIFNGETLNITQWEKKLGLYHSEISARLKRGETFENIVFESKEKGV